MTMISSNVAIPVLLLLCAGFHGTTCQTTDTHENSTHKEQVVVRVVNVDWSYVAFPLTFTCFVLITSVLTVAGHHMHKLTSYIPETCILILIGVLVAGVLRLAGSYHQVIKMVDSQTFLLFILPPIVLDASYALNSRDFAGNIGTILLFAVVGTIINFAIIGPALYGFSQAGAYGELKLPLLTCLLFASLIVAVDPVAVIAIFKDVGVNDMLYFLVFGESLLNDAVTLVLYDVISEFGGETEVTAQQAGMGVAAFFVSSIGGGLIGLVLGILTAYVTKFTYKASAIEPIIVVLLAYLSYLLGSLLGWSSIIAITVCGIVQAQLAFPNLSFESELATKSFATFLGSVFEALVFLALGAEIVEANYTWNTGFVLLSLFLVLFGRMISVFGLTAIANIFRSNKISFREQFIIWYGGLRGALAFALCTMIPAKSVTTDEEKLFMTTTIVVIVFTVFIQGTTMRPFVLLCSIEQRDPDTPALLLEIELMANDHTLSGLELIVGQRGDNHTRGAAYRVDDKMKQIVSKHPSTHANILIDAMEIRALEECSSIRENQPTNPLCFCSCCSSNQIGNSEIELHEETVKYEIAIEKPPVNEKPNGNLNGNLNGNVNGNLNNNLNLYVDLNDNQIDPMEKDSDEKAANEIRM